MRALICKMEELYFANINLKALISTLTINFIILSSDRSLNTMHIGGVRRIWRGELPFKAPVLILLIIILNVFIF